MERAGGGAVNDCRNGSVQVMLFADRLEVWNPGTLPPSLTLEKFRQAHGSVPANPLLAEPMYLADCIERMGTGTRDMIRRCTEAGLPEPEFAGSVRVPDDHPPASGSRTGAAARVLRLLEDEPKSKAELSRELGQKKISDQLNEVVCQLLADQMIEYTIPEKPGYRHQKYRLTEKGRTMLAKTGSRGDTA